MREIFRQRAPRDPGRVYYTITAEDVGKTIIETEIGPIRVSDVIGRVLKNDVGKRLIRVHEDDPNGGWYWQCESDLQRDERLGKQ